MGNGMVLLQVQGWKYRFIRMIKNTEGNFLHFKKQLEKCRFFDKDGQDKKFIDDYERNAPEFEGSPDLRTEEQKRWFLAFCSSVLGPEVLFNVFGSKEEEILLNDSSSFADDSLFCEYHYIINLDQKRFEVKGIKTYSFNNLLTNKDFVKLDEEE